MSRLIKTLFAIGLLFQAEAVCFAQEPQVQTNIASFVAGYSSVYAGRREACKLENLIIDNESRQVRVYANEVLAWYSFDRAKVEQTYQQLRNILPASYKDYKLLLYSKGKLIEELVQGGWEHESDRRWSDRDHRGNAWVTPLDRPYSTKKGLEADDLEKLSGTVHHQELSLPARDKDRNSHPCGYRQHRSGSRYPLPPHRYSGGSRASLD